MRHETRITIVAAAAGFGLAGVLQVAALLVSKSGHEKLASIVDWPTTFLHALVPDPAVAMLAGFPMGGLVYSLVALLVFRRILA
jgi:hypothetical protein